MIFKRKRPQKRGAALLTGLLPLLLSSCIGNIGLSTASLATETHAGWTRLSIGMEEKEVLCVLSYPRKKEKVEKGGETYEVWFYVTRPSVLGQTRLVPQNLTPLVFLNQKVVGWGYPLYRSLFQEKQARSVREKEDRELEEILNQKSPSKEKPSQWEASFGLFRPKEKSDMKREEEDGSYISPEDEEMLDETEEEHFNLG